MSDKFCKSLSNAVSFRVPGTRGEITFNPCCLYNKYLPFHPGFFKRERQRFAKATDFLPECSKCKLKEITHGESLRTHSNSTIPDGIDDRIYKLEIVLDTTCNAACIQCGDTQSSLWRKELSQNKEVFHIQSEYEIDQYIEKISNIVDLSNVKIIHFWGGEPLLTNTHLKFLSLFKDYKDIDLIYTTNGSIFPNQDVLELWSKFKKVRLGISLDGTNDKFHYIRWPLKWDKIVRNLELFKTDTPDNMVFHINCCIIPLNVYYVDELDSWLRENFSQAKNGTPITLNFIRGEGIHDIACTPMKLRELVWTKFTDNHPVSNVLKEVPVLDHTTMIEHLDHWDVRRKLNWRETFKEIAQFFD